jgi:hypothetical protein
MLNGNPEVKNILGEVDRAIADKSISLSKLISMMARRAASRLHELVESNNEQVALKASSEVLDRTPETSKTMKHQVTTWSLDAEDSKALAAALVEGARAKARFAEIAAGDFVRVNTDEGNGNGTQGEAGLSGQERLHPGQRAEVGLGRDSSSLEVKEVQLDRIAERGLPPSEGRPER